MRLWIIFGMVLLNPFWFCILYYVFTLGSIGSIVIITWPINSIVVPTLFFIASNRLPANKFRLVCKFGAIPFGILFALLQLNSYFFLISWFGLDKFEWM